MPDVEEQSKKLRRRFSYGGDLVTQEQIEMALQRLRDFLLMKLGTKAEILRKLDLNGNGEVSLEEFNASLKDLGCPFDELFGDVSLTRIFKELDVDCSDSLSVEELMITNPWQAEEEAVHLLRKALTELFPTKTELLAALDGDKNGSISYGELERSLRTYGISVESATGGFDLGRVFDFLDVDCSGELSMQELLESDPRQASNERDVAIVKFREALIQKWGTKEAMMKAMDTNGNGHLSYAELQDGLQRNHVSLREILGKRDFKWFFRVLDVDRSGQISSKELIDLDPTQEAMRMSESRRRRTIQGKLKKARTMQGMDSPDQQHERSKDANTKPVKREAHEALAQKYKALQAKYKELEARHSELELENKSMGQELWDIRKAHTKIQQDHGKLQEENARLQEERKYYQTDLEQKYKTLQEDHGHVLAQHEHLKVEHRLLKEDHVQLINKHRRLRVSLKSDWDTLSRDAEELGVVEEDVPAKDETPKGSASGDPGADVKEAQKRTEPQAQRRRRPINAFPHSSVDDEKPSWRLPNATDDRPNSSVGLRNRMASLRGQLSYVTEASDNTTIKKTWSWPWEIVNFQLKLAMLQAVR